MMRKLLYIFYIPLLLIEWIVDLIHQIWGVIHKSIETLTLSLHEYIVKKPGS